VRRRLAKVGLGLLALATVLPALSCGGGSSSTGGVVEPAVCLEFSADAAPSSSTVVARRGDASTCDRLAFDLVITDVNDVFAADFKLSFDPTVLRFTGASDDGSVLASDGTQVALLYSENAGLLDLSIARLGASAGGIDIGGTQLLVRVSFLRLADSGGSALSFSGERVWNSQAALVPGVSWSGGSVTIR